jgi:hypothetical protein
MKKLPEVRICLVTMGLLLLMITGCEKENNIPDPEFSIEDYKITSRYCSGFGNQIVTCYDHVLISSYYSVYIYKFDGQNIEQLQTIEFNESSTIVNMKVSGSTLALGIDQYDGYKVLIYERKENTWTFSQEIKSERSGDGFGISIDIDGDYMVIGEPGQKPYGVGVTKGRVYFYHKTSEGWTQVNEFSAEEPVEGDEFGRTVAVNNDIAIAGSWWTYAHIYNNYNGAWSFSGLDTISVTAVFHSDSSFLYFDSGMNLRSFILEENGYFSFHPVSFSYGMDEIVSFHMTDSYALAAGSTVNRCYLLKYGTTGWKKDSDLRPDTGESCNFYGLAFSGDYVIIGGASDSLTGISYVYFRKYK